MPPNAPFEILARAEQLLRRHAWLVGSAPAAIDALLAGARIQRHERGQYLFHREEASHDAWLVVDGFVTTGVVGPDGKAYTSHWFGAGAVLNIVSAMDAQSAIHDCIARTDSISVQIKGCALQAFLDQHPGAKDAILRYLCGRIRYLQRLVRESALATLRARCAQVLVDLADEHGIGQDDGVRLAFSLTQESLGEMLGCTRQSVNKELQLFEREGLIRFTRSCCVLLERARLDAIAFAG